MFGLQSLVLALLAMLIALYSGSLELFGVGVVLIVVKGIMIPRVLNRAVANAFLVRQRNYKRMLAYSSVEHIGIICLGLGFGGYWGLFGALMHVVSHALSKSLLFILSGNILLKYHSAEIREVRGLLHTAPWTGGSPVRLR